MYTKHYQDCQRAVALKNNNSFDDNEREAALTHLSPGSVILASFIGPTHLLRLLVTTEQV